MSSLIYILVDSFITDSIWVKGGRTGFVNFKEWAHKVSREEEPSEYWFWFVFYSLGLLVIIYLLIFKM